MEEEKAASAATSEHWQAVAARHEAAGAAAATVASPEIQVLLTACKLWCLLDTQTASRWHLYRYRCCSVQEALDLPDCTASMLIRE